MNGLFDIKQSAHVCVSVSENHGLKSYF